VTYEDLERRVAALEHDRAMTRWYTGRVDRDLAEIATTQTEHTATLADHTDRLNRIESKQVEHDGRFDSMEAQLRSLTQLVGQVLDRMSEPDQTAD
jgi:chromosome segregation ATPase